MRRSTITVLLWSAVALETWFAAEQPANAAEAVSLELSFEEPAPGQPVPDVSVRTGSAIPLRAYQQMQELLERRLEHGGYQVTVEPVPVRRTGAGQERSGTAWSLRALPDAAPALAPAAYEALVQCLQISQPYVAEMVRDLLLQVNRLYLDGLGDELRAEYQFDRCRRPVQTPRDSFLSPGQEEAMRASLRRLLEAGVRPDPELLPRTERDVRPFLFGEGGFWHADRGDHVKAAVRDALEAGVPREEEFIGLARTSYRTMTDFLVALRAAAPATSNRFRDDLVRGCAPDDEVDRLHAPFSLADCLERGGLQELHLELDGQVYVLLHAGSEP
jgi:hypothetical protein